MMNLNYSRRLQLTSGRYPIVILLVLFVLSSAAIFVHLQNLHIRLIESTTAQSARQYVEVLSQFRHLYNSEVVQTALKQGLKVTHDYQSTKGAIPLPVTLGIMLGEKMSIEGVDVKARLYSAYPFPWRTRSGGLQDEFGQQAWQFLNKNKHQPFIRVEHIDGIPTLRYAVADLMQDTCIDCHNDHPQAPKTDWQTGDVRGILEVDQPLVAGLSHVSNIFIEIAVLISLLLLAGLGIVAFMVKYVRRANRATIALNEQLAQEVSQRKAAEADTASAKDEANLANQTKSIFLANISHEIRTPMNAIMGYSQILKRDSTMNEDQQHSLQVIEQSGDHLLNLINDVLDISKVESGVQQLNQSAFNLIDMLNGLCDMFKLKAQQKGLAWHVELDFIHAKVWIKADESKLRQILINIIGNAIKFTDKGFVKLTASEHTEGVFYIEVTDTGMGIDEKDRSALFAPFNQGESGSQKGGTGLGLTISKKYLELMGSTLLLKSKPGDGTTIGFYLELKHCDAPSEGVTQQRSYKCLAKTHNISVLVVDDINVNRHVLTRILEDARFNVTPCSGALMALDLMNNASFDLIITDIIMPEIDGIALMKRGKKTKLNHLTPVIGISASNLQQQKADFINMGFTSYLRKPFLIDDLLGCIAQILQVKFEYMDESPKVPDLIDKICTNRPTGAVVETLRQAAELSRVSDIETLLCQLAKQDQHYDHFIRTIKSFIAQYDMDELIAFLDQEP